MLQYKIPQDVGVADKIVGPLTLRQLIIVAIGGGISYVLYAIASKLYELNILEYIIIALPALLALAAAFIKINGIPFIKFVLLALEFTIKPKQRLWDHRGIAAIVAPDLGEGKPVTAAKTVKGEGKTKADVNLDELSQVLDSGGFDHVEEIKHEDIDHADDDDLMTQAYFGEHKKESSATKNMYWRTKESHKKRLDALAKMPATKPKEKTTVAAVAPARTEARSGGERPKVKQAVQSQVATAEKPVPPVPSEVRTEVAPAKGSESVEEAKGDAIGSDRSATSSHPSGAQARREQAEPVQKKKRRRKRKPKRQMPTSPATQVDTTQKKKPAKFTPKQSETPPAPPTPSGAEDQGPREGEIQLEELQRGEIELNLD